MDLKSKPSWLYLVLAACLSIILLRNTGVGITVSSVPGPVPSIHEQAFLKQIDRPATGYFYSFQLIHAGDLHGQRISIDAYDYDQVLAWLDLLNTFLPQSEIAPFLATFYFSNTHDRSSIYRLIDFLKRYTESDLNLRWRWFTYGIYLAQHHLNDFTYAYQMAMELSETNISSLPLWVREIPGFLLMKMNHTDQAQAFFQKLLRSSNNLSTEERLFLQHRLKTLAD